MAKFSAKELKTIKQLAQQDIPAMVQAGCDEQAYNAKRAELNAHIIQLCVGGEIVDLKGKKEGQSTFKFNKTLPTKKEVAEVADILNNFIATIENPFLLNLQRSEDDDMSIQTGDVYAANIVAYDKPKNKDLKAKILGTEGIAYYQMKLSGLDVITLAGIGEEARKNANFKKMIIIGGAVILVAAAAGIGYYIYSEKKNDACDCDTCDCDVDIDDVDIDDVPEVEME